VVKLRGFEPLLTASTIGNDATVPWGWRTPVEFEKLHATDVA
jgi:hypothetical protein